MPPAIVIDAATSLIGRDEELPYLEAQVVGSTRLLTLHGPAGVGKSRLARAVAARTSGSFPEGSFWCDLQGSTTRQQILDGVALASGVDATTTHGSEVLNGPRGIMEGAVLLVLDNAEGALPHLGALASRWLETNQRLSLVVTSRERLGVAAETVRWVAPLTTAAAVQLLSLRLQALRPGCHSDSAVLEAIVERVDRLPLAIELVARYGLSLACGELLERLEPALPFLTACRYAGTGRAGSFRAALDDTWRGLSEAERTVAAYCALYRNAFTLADAEALCAPGTSRVAIILTQLVEKCLLCVESSPNGEYTMFRMLRLTREYLAEQSQAGHRSIVERYVQVVRSVAAEQSLVEEPQSRELAPATVAWLRRHQATLTWLAVQALQDHEQTSAVQILVLLSRLALLQGPVRPSLTLLEAIPLAELSDPKLGCEGFLARARLRIRDGQLRQAQVDLESALELASTCKLVALEAPLLTALAECQRRSGELEQARSTYRAALAHYVDQANMGGRIRVESALAGLAFEEGALNEARNHSNSALSLLRAQDMPLTAGVVLQNLGVILQELGELENADFCFRTALTSHQTLGHRRFEGIGEFDLGTLALESGALGEAKARFTRAAALAREVGDRREEGLSEALLVVCEARAAELERAEQHLRVARLTFLAASEPALLDVLEVHAGHVDLARALTALLDAEETQQRYHFLAAEERLAAPRRGTSDELRFAQRLLRASCERYARLGEELLVRRDGSWFRTPDGVHVELTHRPPLQRLMRELVRHLDVAPGNAVGTEQLIRAGWPEQRVLSSAAKNRLHVALTTLRKGGLGPRLLRKDDGYLLDRAIPLGPLC